LFRFRSGHGFLTATIPLGCFFCFRRSLLLKFRQFVDGLVVGVVGGRYVAMHPGYFFRPVEKCHGYACVRVVAPLFGEYAEEGGFHTLGSHETPGAGGDLIDKDALGLVGGLVGLMESFAEIFERGGVFAGHDDLCAGEAVTCGVAAGGEFSGLGFWAGTALGVFAIGEDLCGRCHVYSCLSFSRRLWDLRIRVRADFSVSRWGGGG
jgi:hypothetical protein